MLIKLRLHGIHEYRLLDLILLYKSFSLQLSSDKTTKISAPILEKEVHADCYVNLQGALGYGISPSNAEGLGTLKQKADTI